MTPHAWFRRDWLLAPAVLIAEILIFYRKIIFSSHYVIPWDLRYYHLPLASFIASSFRQGKLPLWDPYTYCGAPFFANIQAQVFYPPTFIAVLIANLFERDRLIYLLEAQLLLHVLLGGLFTWFLLREMEVRIGPALIGATIFQCGPYFTSQAQHLGAIDGAAWIPLACWSVVRLSKAPSVRWTGVLALAFSLSVISGFPSTAGAAFICAFVLAIALAALRMASWRLLLRCFGAALLAVALSSIQLLPSLQAAALSVSKFRADFRLQTFGIPWQAFVSMIWPDRYHLFDLSHYTLPSNPTFLYLYCGILALILFPLALMRRTKYGIAFAALTLVSLFSMLGTRTPPGRVFFPAFLNMVGDWMYVEFMMVGFALGISVLAALGANSLPRIPLVHAVILAVVFLDLTLVGSGRPMNTASVIVEPGVSYSQFAGSRELIERVRGLVRQWSPPARFDLFNDWGGWVTIAPLTELPTANGDDPFALYRFMQVRLLFSKGERWGRFYEVTQPDSPILDLLNVRFLLSSTPLPDDRKFVKVADLPGRLVYENRAALPRFFLVQNVESEEDMAGALRRLASIDFDARSAAVVEHGVGAHYPEGSGDQVQVERYESNEVVLRTESAQPRYLVTSESNYPGWRAWVDGNEQPVLQTNVAFRGLYLPAGNHRVVFRFRPTILYWAASVSGFACLILGSILFIPKSEFWRRFRP